MKSKELKSGRGFVIIYWPPKNDIVPLEDYLKNAWTSFNRVRSKAKILWIAKAIVFILSRFIVILAS